MPLTPSLPQFLYISSTETIMGLDDEKMRFSNVIPNSWWRNLKKYAKQSTTKKETTGNTDNHTLFSSESVYSSSLAAPSATQHQSPKLLNQPRKSYHITRELSQPLPIKKTEKKPHKDFLPVELPRKSLRRKSTKKNRPIPSLAKKVISSSSSSSSPSVSANCTCRSNSPDFTEHDQTSSSELDTMFDDTCKCRHTKNQQFHPELAPIITKNRHHAINIDRKVNIVQEDLPPTRRISTSSTGFKLKTNSPRIANCRRVNQTGRKSELSRLGVYESFAVVKTSKNPRRDFRESMVEMILENNMMESSKDLEDLLACYLSLNSHEYHDTIINVFKQIWVDYLHVSLKS